MLLVPTYREIVASTTIVVLLIADAETGSDGRVNEQKTGINE